MRLPLGRERDVECDVWGGDKVLVLVVVVVVVDEAWSTGNGVAVGEEEACPGAGGHEERRRARAGNEGCASYRRASSAVPSVVVVVTDILATARAHCTVVVIMLSWVPSSNRTGDHCLIILEAHHRRQTGLQLAILHAFAKACPELPPLSPL